MKIQRIFIIFAFLGVMFAVATAQESHIYCGRNLALTLAMLCENGMLMKRAESYNALTPPRDWPWLAPHHARSLEGPRGKRQVVSECCDKPCTLDELLSYCN